MNAPEPEDVARVVALRGAAPSEGAVGATWRALSRVHDPELYLDVVALGFIYDIREIDNGVEVDMTLTTPGCPASQSIPEIAREAIQGEIGDKIDAIINIVWDPPWSPAMIDVDAAAAMGFRVRS